VAKKRKTKSSWLKKLLFLILTPFVVWALAFLIWFYWYDILAISSGQDKTPRTGASKEVGKSTKTSDKPSNERIGEEDRRKLDEILKSKK
jgi:cytoskeletal protein RodZ